MTTQQQMLVLMTVCGLQMNFTIHQDETTVTTLSSGLFLSTLLMTGQTGQLQIFFTGNPAVLRIFLLLLHPLSVNVPPLKFLLKSLLPHSSRLNFFTFTPYSLPPVPNNIILLRQFLTFLN